MALFVNPGKDWEKNMSEEDIAQMESQGYDVTELRAKRAKSAEEEEKERLREKEERENFKNPTNPNKLAPYLQTPCVGVTTYTFADTKTEFAGIIT